MLAEVGYRGYGPSTYRATYNILYGEWQANLSECESQKTSVSTPFSAQVYLTYIMGFRRNAVLPYGCAITILYYIASVFT